MPTYLCCSVCREAYFITPMALARHELLCQAMRTLTAAYILTPSSESSSSSSSSPATSHLPLDLSGKPSLSSRSSASSAKSSSSSSTSSSTPTLTTTATYQTPLDLTRKTSHLLPSPPKKLKTQRNTKSNRSELSMPSTSGTSQHKAPSVRHPSSPARPDMPIVPPRHLPSSSSSSSAGGTLTWYQRKALKHARMYVIDNNGAYTHLEAFLEEALTVAKKVLAEELDKCDTLKYNLVLEARYGHPDGLVEEFNFKTRNKTLFFDSPRHFDSLLRKDAEKLLGEEAEATQKNSGWFLETPLRLTVRVSQLRCKQPSGSCYVKLPRKLNRRHATINVQNTDNRCFLYSVLTKHLPGVNYQSVLTEDSFTDVLEQYNLNGITFPTPPRQLSKFERNNPGCSINLFECGPEGIITPYKIVDHELEDHTDLLLYKPETGQSHYIYITDYSKLIKPQIAKGSNSIVVCKRCTTHKQVRNCRPDAETWLKEHMYYCIKDRPSRIVLPDESASMLKFEHYENLVPVPIICTADFEASLIPTVRTDNAYQMHEANSFSILVHSDLPEDVLAEAGISTSVETHITNDAGGDLLLYLKELAESVEPLYSRYKAMRPLTNEELEKHFSIESCELCGQTFEDARQQSQTHHPTSATRTCDHCHITGEPRRTICNRCNLRCRQVNFIPVYMHNFSGYDANLLLKSLHVLKGHEVQTVPANSSKFVSISVRIGNIWLRFLDSYRLMDASLASLAENLSSSELIKSSKLVPLEHLDLITRKGVYPYDYVTGKHVFSETALPPKEAFYSRLNDESISDAEYQHAQDVWDKLGMTTFEDFHRFYLSLDASLLMDILLSFRNRCLKTYKVDCCRYYTAPGLAFSAMLLTTRVELELLTDPDQLFLVENAIRGGIVQCPLRYARANNTRLDDPITDYRPDEPQSHLFYWDCTNLYGYAMSQPLPTGGFRWEEPESIDWLTHPRDSPRGLILECDVTVPADVHDKLQQLPPLAEVKCPPGSKFKKLMTTLHDKERYTAHYTVFQQAVGFGLKVTKVHKVLSFSQSCWMKGFIEMNAELRANSSDAFSRSFYKLMNNAVFGKTMESVRKRQNVRIATTPEQLERYFRKPRFVEYTIISEDVVAVHLRKEKVLMNKPVSIGLCVLDISKVHMYNFFYNTICSHFKASEGHKVELAYIDTDGILVKITTHSDVFQIIRQPTFYSQLDQTVYPRDHPLKGDENKGRLGVFKDECAGREVYELIALRPKMYAYRFSSKGSDSKLRAKGIKTGYVKRNLVFENYKKILFGDSPVEKAEYNLIRRSKFQLTSVRVRKKSLSAEDDKRVVLDDGIHTLPWGHYSLTDEQEIEDEQNTEEDSDSDCDNDTV